MGPFYITGASGVIGSALATHFGTRAVAVARRPCPDFSSSKLTKAYESADWLDDPDGVILHCAGYSNPREAWPDYGSLRDAHIKPQLQMIETLVHRGWHGRLVYFSTAGIYGNAQSLPIPESHPAEPVSPYAQHKLELEQKFADLAARHGFELVILRIANPYGASAFKPHQGVIPLLFNAARTDTPFRLIGSGKSLRDYIALSDLCRAVEAAAVVPLQTPLTLNIGSGKGTRLLELIALLEQLLNRQIKLEQRPAEQEPSDSVLDINNARQTLGWAPEIPLKTGLRSLL